MEWWAWILVVVVAIAVVMAIISLPDLARYLKIRRM